MSSNGGATGMGSESYQIEESTIKEIEKDASGSRSASDPSIRVEKGQAIHVSNHEEDDDESHLMLSHEFQFPIDPNAPVETHQFTIRATFVGCCLGGVIAASK
jgi:hypothetical protein